MKIITINDLSNVEIRDMIEGFGYSLEGFIISHEDFISIRALAERQLNKRVISLEEALEWAFITRMSFMEQEEKVSRAKSKAERAKLSSICPDSGAFPHQQQRRYRSV